MLPICAVLPILCCFILLSFLLKRSDVQRSLYRSFLSPLFLTFIIVRFTLPLLIAKSSPYDSLASTPDWFSLLPFTVVPSKRLIRVAEPDGARGQRPRHVAVGLRVSYSAALRTQPAAQHQRRTRKGMH